MPDTSNKILAAFNRQRPDIEMLRSRLMIGILLGAMAMMTGLLIFGTNDLQILIQNDKSVYATIIMLAICTLIELFVYWQVRHTVKSGRNILRGPLILFTLLEISFPTIVILGICYIEGNGYALDSPTYSAYFFILIVSTLHLDAILSLVAGIFAAVTHLFMVVYVFEVVAVDAPETIAMPLSIYMLRSISIFVGGLAASFVARQLQKRMISSISAVQDKKTVERLFGEQVSPEVVATLLDEDRPERKLTEASIMFLDIRNFTAYAGTISPEELIDYQNRIFSPLLHIINTHGGIVNQILGDGFMATFGVPKHNDAHVHNAYKAGLDILVELKRLSITGIIPETEVGIGLHTGTVVTGNIGNTVRKQFSIAGTNVNFASRLEQLNKIHGTQYLVSEAVTEQLPESETALMEKVPNQTLKGYPEPVSVYIVQVPETKSEAAL